MKISTRLMLGYSIVGLLFGMVGYVGFNTINTINSEYHDVAEQTVPVIVALHDLRFRSERIATITSEFIFIITEAEVEGKEVSAEEIAHEELELELAKERYDTALKRYEDLVNRFFPEEKIFLENIRSAGEDLQKASAELIALKKQGVVGQKVLEKEEEFEEDQKAFLVAVDVALAQEDEEFAERRENIESATRTGIITIAIVGALVVIIALLNGVSIFRSVSRPITKLRDAAVEIGRGRFDARVDIKSKDEMGVLAGALNQMADDLSTSTVSRDYFNDIIQSMIDSLIVVDPGGSIKTVNQASLNLLGYEEKELIGKPFDVVFTEKKPSVDDLIKEGRVTNIEKTYLAKDGSRIPVSFSSSIIRAYDGAVQGLVCVAEDITERKKAETELNKRLEELERWHEVTVDREVKMVELKDRIEELEEEIERSKGK